MDEVKPEIVEEPVKKPEPVLPEKIQMLMQWSYIDKDKNHMMWREGTVVTDPDQIKRIIVDCKFKYYKVMK